MNHDADLSQFPVAPDGARNADRNTDQEHQSPVHSRQNAAQHQPQDAAADGRNLVDAKRQSSLVGGKSVGQDRRRGGEQECPAHALNRAKGDQLPLTGQPQAGGEGSQQRTEREHHKTQIVKAHLAMVVRDPAEGNEQHRRRQVVPHQHP